MHIADFALERYFARWEFAVRHVLCASDVEPLAMGELLAMADDDSRARWEALRLAYTESLGLPALREAIADLYDGIAADDVITFAGAEEGVFVGMHAALERGDHAVVVWPAYQSLYEVARSIGADVTLVGLDPRDWSLDVDAIAAAMRPNTRLIVANFPHSPTGAQITPEQLARLVSIAELHGARLFSDEVYRFLEHDGRPLPAGADLSRSAVSLGVMSKSFALPGLRIGWIATRDAAFRARLASIKDYTTICNSAPSEMLALMALRARDDILARSRGIVRTNLARLDAFFARHEDRFAWVRPRAGTVCFPRYLGGDVEAFCADLVASRGVLLLPGSQFGYPGGHFRLGYGRTDMPAALDELEAFLAG
ncbi:MAG TPA: aminotransferase class I/II-fold pyridoxal phosphate-dependent enzyme [Gemmatimonadaceae bacterium]|nr:aminotransferase class I/II-fold pyridoxal phosphate-dependent enzyme [Gemmatimonadaceae bacterium]